MMKNVRAYWCHFRKKAKNTKWPNRKSEFQYFNTSTNLLLKLPVNSRHFLLPVAPNYYYISFSRSKIKKATLKCPNFVQIPVRIASICCQVLPDEWCSSISLGFFYLTFHLIVTKSHISSYSHCQVPQSENCCLDL